MRRSSINISTLLLFTVLFLTASTVTSFAQEAEEAVETEEAVVDSVEVEIEVTDLMRAQDLFVVTKAELDSLYALEPQINSSKDEKLLLLRVQVERHIAIIDDNEPELRKLLPKLDQADPEVTKLNQDVGEYLGLKFDIYERSISWWAQEVDALRDMRSTAAEEELAELETQISQARGRLDELLPVIADILKNGDLMGIDTADDWERFGRALNNRAENLVGRVQITVNHRDELTKKIAAAERAGTPEAEIGIDRVRLQHAEDRVKGLAKSLETTANLLSSQGFETTQYRQFIIKSTGEISEKVLDPRVLLGLTRDFLEEVGQWFKDNGPTYLVKLLIITGSIVFFRIAFRLTWWLMRLVRLISLTKLMVQLGNSMLSPLATITGLFFGFWLIGADPTTLLAGAGVAGVVIGFALQDSLANLAAGFFILATRPFDVDDVIRTGTVVGTVKAMWIANTTVVTFDGRRLLIPNRKIWADIIENRSVEPLRRSDITVRVGFKEDLDRAITILHDLVQKEGRVLDHPEPVIFVSKWADSWVTIKVRPWTRNEDWWPLMTDLPRLVVQRFAEEGIEIPYPRRELAGSGGVPFEIEDEGPVEG